MAKPSRGRRPSQRLRFEHLEARHLLSGGPTFTVSDPGDSSTGQTLRAALLAANTATTGPFTIDFHLTGSTTIKPLTPLPTITATVAVVIDGTSEPGYNGKPIVVLDGSNAGAGANGLTIDTNNAAMQGGGPGAVIPPNGVTIEGLAIDKFGGAGVSIAGSGSNSIQKSYIGVDATGETAAANATGVSITDSPANVLGVLTGASFATGNVISGNTGTGVSITGSKSVSNILLSNEIGTDAAGAKAIANGIGVSAQGATTTDVDTDLISGNTHGGISFATGSGNSITRSLIGTDITGEKPLGNGGFGIQVNAETGDQIGASGSSVSDVVSGNTGPGIDVTGSHSTTVNGNFIGLDRAGTAAMGNTVDGILVENSSVGTSIGGTAGNFISANQANGVDVQTSSTGTVIRGNVIGADISGLLGIGNVQNGIVVQQTSASIVGNLILDNGNPPAGGKTPAYYSGILLYGGSGSSIQSNHIGDVAAGAHVNALDGIFSYGSSNNTIGGAGAGNVITGNANFGVEIQSGSNNVVAGNFIGLTPSGQALPASVKAGGNQDGVVVFDATGTTIGGAATNYIGGNKVYGIDIHGLDSSGTLISANIIGLAIDGTSSAANDGGIYLDNAAYVVIRYNIISDNTVDGIYVSGGYNSVISTNLIGTDATGLKAAGNGNDGIQIVSAANIVVGGSSTSARNTISGNGGDGVQVEGAGATSNTIADDWIGLGVSGVKALGNGAYGVEVDDVPGTIIGGVAGGFNVVGGNGASGIYINGAGAIGTAITGNIVGLGADGTTAVGNLVDGVVVQGTPGVLIAYDTLSSNTNYGIHITGAGATAAQIGSNLIGTDFSGNLARGNAIAGVILDGSSGAVVGGKLGGNVISGNLQDGVFIFGPSAVYNQVAGNIIGLNAAGNAALGNGLDGVLIQAPSNLIGGNTAGSTNIISGNDLAGIRLVGGSAGGTTGNVIASNWIGTDRSGSRAIGNAFYGVDIDGSGATAVANNLVGGTGSAFTNVIVGSGVIDVSIIGAMASGNSVSGNLIGTDVTGTVGLFATPNGIVINAAPNNTIGGTTPGQGNIIAGAATAGVTILNSGASGNLVVGNSIGRGYAGGPTLANGTGVVINGAPNNTVGGAASGAANAIIGNKTNTIQVSGATGNITTGNIIGPDA